MKIFSILIYVGMTIAKPQNNGYDYNGLQIKKSRLDLDNLGLPQSREQTQNIQLRNFANSLNLEQIGNSINLSQQNNAHGLGQQNSFVNSHKESYLPPLLQQPQIPPKATPQTQLPPQSELLLQPQVSQFQLQPQIEPQPQQISQLQPPLQPSPLPILPPISQITQLQQNVQLRPQQNLLQPNFQQQAQSNYYSNDLVSGRHQQSNSAEAKNIYVHLPQHQQILQQPLYRVPPRKHYKIILVKSPNRPPPPPVHVPAVEEKTLVYVLIKKPDAPSSEELQAVLQQQQSVKTSKPEVYFIKYKTNNNENPKLQPSVETGAHLGNPGSQINIPLSQNPPSSYGSNSVLPVLTKQSNNLYSAPYVAY